MMTLKPWIFVTTLLICARGAVSDQKCTMNFGACQDVQNSCSGTYLAYLCDGPYTRRCCVPAFFDELCHARGGKCQATSITCFGGSYVTGLCGGPQDRRCCISNFTDSAYHDAQCHDRGGTCKYTNIACVGGSYVAGLCGGPINRRCCVPTVHNECGERAKALACKLHEATDKVLFLTSSAEDRPWANLKDMCDGRKAIRSKDRCDKNCPETGHYVCLNTTLLEYLVALKEKGEILIKELTGTCHKHSCSHQWGKAVDLRRDRRVTDYIKTCHDMNGTAQPRAQIIHCHF